MASASASLDEANHSAVVIDNGTGFTKLGYAGNSNPSFVFPTTIATMNEAKTAQARRTGLEDLDFVVGEQARELSQRGGYDLSFPMKAGQVESWDHMERIWEHCFFKYLRCEPEEQYVMLTEPPMNAPENREYTAEIMFETFNVKGLHIAVQAVLALCATWGKHKMVDTGTVIDSGDGVTHIIPVVDGYVIGSAIKHVPLAGRSISEFVVQLIKEREYVPPEDISWVAHQIKEKYGYICRDLPREFAMLDTPGTGKNKRVPDVFEAVLPTSGQNLRMDVGHEAFLGPELFFSPEIFSSQFTTPLPAMVDSTIQQCPIDSRRLLYQNIVLSGGSTMFPNFGKRLKRDVTTLVDSRIRSNLMSLGMAPGTPAFESEVNTSVKEMGVNVLSHRRQRFAVWFGGAQLASMPQFEKMVVSKAEYDEHGPSICRMSKAIFSALSM